MFGENENAGFKAIIEGMSLHDNWLGQRLYSDFPKEKMLEAIFKGNVIVNCMSKNTVKALSELGTPEIFIEPGRSIIGDAAVFLAKVAFVRKVADCHNLITLETGISNFGGSGFKFSFKPLDSY